MLVHVESFEVLSLVLSGTAKRYHELKHHYWLGNMRIDIMDYVSRCVSWQQMKVKNLTPGSEFRILPNLQ